MIQRVIPMSGSNSLSNLRRFAPAIMLIALACIALGGCRAGAKRAATDFLGPASPASRSLTLEQTMLASHEAQEFDVLGGSEQGEVVSQRAGARDDGAAGHWTISLRRSVGDRQLFEQQMLIGEHNALVMKTLVNNARDVITRFDPPTMIFPAELSPGERVEQTVGMSVHPIDDPSKTQHKGTGTLTLWIEGDQEVRTGAGPVNAVHVRSTFESDLGSIKVLRTTDRWFVPESGLVAEQYEEVVRLLGVVVETSSETILRRAL